MGYRFGIGSGREKVVSDFGAGRRNFKLPVRIWGIRMRSSSGLVGAFMMGKRKEWIKNFPKSSSESRFEKRSRERKEQAVLWGKVNRAWSRERIIR